MLLSVTAFVLCLSILLMTMAKLSGGNTFVAPTAFAQTTAQRPKRSQPQIPQTKTSSARQVIPSDKAQVEKITDSLYRIGKALVDTRARTVTCTGEINMDSGAIEYLAVAPLGKTHESLLRIDVRPLHLQVALLLLGLEPKNVLERQGEKKTPQGAPIEIRVRWRDKAGKQRDVRAEELIAELPGSKPMVRHDWLFTGSRIVKEGFEADLEKSLVAVWHDPAALLDNPLPGGGSNAYIVNARTVPKRGTPVEFVLHAVEIAPSKPVSAGNSPEVEKRK